MMTLWVGVVWVEFRNCHVEYTTLYFLCVQGDVWICMELMDSSMDKISEKVYNQLHKRIPEEILGKMSVAVSCQRTNCDDPLPVI